MPGWHEAKGQPAKDTANSILCCFDKTTETNLRSKGLIRLSSWSQSVLHAGKSGQEFKAGTWSDFLMVCSACFLVCSRTTSPGWAQGTANMQQNSNHYCSYCKEVSIVCLATVFAYINVRLSIVFPDAGLHPVAQAGLGLSFPFLAS